MRHIDPNYTSGRESGTPCWELAKRGRRKPHNFPQHYSREEVQGSKEIRSDLGDISTSITRDAGDTRRNAWGGVLGGNGVIVC